MRTPVTGGPDGRPVSAHLLGSPIACTPQHVHRRTQGGTHMHAFSAAMADEVALTRSQLWSARERRDESAVADALARLRDLRDIAERAREGLLLS